METARNATFEVEVNAEGEVQIRNLEKLELFRGNVIRSVEMQIQTGKGTMSVDGEDMDFRLVFNYTGTVVKCTGKAMASMNRLFLALEGRGSEMSEEERIVLIREFANLDEYQEYMAPGGAGERDEWKADKDEMTGRVDGARWEVTVDKRNERGLMLAGMAMIMEFQFQRERAGAIARLGSTDCFLRNERLAKKRLDAVFQSYVSGNNIFFESLPCRGGKDSWMANQEDGKSCVLTLEQFLNLEMVLVRIGNFGEDLSGVDDLTAVILGIVESIRMKSMINDMFWKMVMAKVEVCSHEWKLKAHTVSVVSKKQIVYGRLPDASMMDVYVMFVMALGLDIGLYANEIKMGTQWETTGEIVNRFRYKELSESTEAASGEPRGANQLRHQAVEMKQAKFESTLVILRGGRSTDCPASVSQSYMRCLGNAGIVPENWDEVIEKVVDSRQSFDRGADGSQSITIQVERMEFGEGKSGRDMRSASAYSDIEAPIRDLKSEQLRVAVVSVQAVDMSMSTEDIKNYSGNVGRLAIARTDAGAINAAIIEFRDMINGMMMRRKKKGASEEVTNVRDGCQIVVQKTKYEVMNTGRAVRKYVVVLVVKLSRERMGDSEDWMRKGFEQFKDSLIGAGPEKRILRTERIIGEFLTEDPVMGTVSDGKILENDVVIRIGPLGVRWTKNRVRVIVKPCLVSMIKSIASDPSARGLENVIRTTMNRMETGWVLELGYKADTGKERPYVDFNQSRYDEFTMGTRTEYLAGGRYAGYGNYVTGEREKKSILGGASASRPRTTEVIRSAASGSDRATKTNGNMKISAVSMEGAKKMEMRAEKTSNAEEVGEEDSRNKSGSYAPDFDPSIQNAGVLRRSKPAEDKSGSENMMKRRVRSSLGTEEEEVVMSVDDGDVAQTNDDKYK
jgi:hypothetical protein